MSKPKPTKIISSFVVEINSVKSPRTQVIVACGVLELLVNTVVEHKFKHGKTIAERTRDYPYSVKLVLMNEKGIISDHFYNLMDALRKIRNAAAHEAQFQLTEEMLLPFKNLTDITGFHKLDEPKSFPFLCNEIVVRFWNTFVQILAPIFEPDLFKKKEAPKQESKGQ